jgi:hypothetical protein
MFSTRSCRFCIRWVNPGIGSLQNIAVIVTVKCKNKRRLLCSTKPSKQPIRRVWNLARSPSQRPFGGFGQQAQEMLCRTVTKKPNGNYTEPVGFPFWVASHNTDIYTRI